MSIPTAASEQVQHPAPSSPGTPLAVRPAGPSTAAPARLAELPCQLRAAGSPLQQLAACGTHQPLWQPHKGVHGAWTAQLLVVVGVGSTSQGGVAGGQTSGYCTGTRWWWHTQHGA